MSFQPIVPLGGLVGWSFLNRTLETQTNAFNSGSQITRDTEYFEQNIASVETAEQLVSDRRLLRVALGAFGLGDDLDSKALIQQVLEGGTEKTDALATKMADDRYRDFADAFGFGNASGRRTANPGFGAETTAQFRRVQFEVAVGDQDESMRVAMDAQRNFDDIAEQEGNDEVRWLKIMGSPPLRKLFETALGLPDSFGQIDLDKQVEVFSERASRQLGLGDLTQLSDPDVQNAVIERFLLRDQVSGFVEQSSASVALTLLQNAPQLF
ncbi:DUF1217 domain-containing protein [Rhodobacteraceae bacterium KMM 6894]|nr:DUF1217 domain-containing protein [Rhodobacteraceae bacterium KMM 6894]